MRYINISEYGGPEVIEIKEGQIPDPGKCEVLINVHAAGVNRPDVMQRQGLYPPPPGASPILGLEVSGEITATGSDVSNCSVSDRVPRRTVQYTLQTPTKKAFIQKIGQGPGTRYQLIF